MRSPRADALIWYGGGSVVVALVVSAVITAPMYVAAGITAITFAVLALKPNLSLYAIFALAFFVPVTISIGLPGLMLTYVFGAILALCGAGRAVRILSGQQHPSEKSGYLLLLLLIVGAGIIHGLGPAALESASRALIVLIVLVWHVSAEAKLSPDRMRRVALMIAWAAPLLLVLAVYQRFAGYWPVLDELAISPSYKSTGDASRSAAIMGHPILYSAYCMVAITIAISVRSKWSTLLLISAGLGLILSGSRSAWIATAVVLFFFIVSKRPKPTPAGIGVVFLSVIAVMTAAVFFPAALDNVWGALSGRLTDLGESQSALARLLRNDLAWRQITESSETFFLGLGPGALAAYFTRNKVGDNLASTFDNSYLTLWYEYGFFAALLLAMLLLIGVIKGAAPGRLLLIGCATQIALFDFYQWPLMLGAVALAVGLRERTPAEAAEMTPTTPAGAQAKTPVRTGRKLLATGRYQPTYR